ncbi:MAG: hypothetical protein AVDCRST_MAG03-659 [uncultured Rubrobacteraceae bacterium]|uniref:Alkaline phosphatase n=1 Tax=uncultured Rubrobacteraceae bacterium TaxID=349277 RepID=A0A6J4NQ56_9ACTN|nr:MAG: hypothetical protein AVDCRST_MAG03-659 [uncultured Rubrobacteraceae bacterium]
MRKLTTLVAVMVLAVVLSAGAALAAVKHGTNAGEAIHGTQKPDTVYAYGGADLVYGYGGADTLYGGNEAGWGDKLLGGAAGDRVLGQGGDDALYGQGGDDRVYGGSGGDLVVGGPGSDALDGGPGADEVNARDGRKDTIVIGAGDLVYYDRGIDALQRRASSREDAGRGAGAGAELTAAEAADAADLSAARPPEGLFGHTGEVLVEHGGETLLVAEGDLENHLGHGDEIVDPTGRAGAGRGQR